MDTGCPTAVVRSLFFYVFARMVDATLMMGVLGCGGGDGNVPWPCTHGRCYANDVIVVIDDVVDYDDDNA